MTAPALLEVDVQFLIASSQITAPLAIRRLNGFENTLTALARTWRNEQPIRPAAELRMSDDTRIALLAWFGAPEDDSVNLHQRLAPYVTGAVLDDAIRSGWVRLLLDRTAASRC